MKLNINNKKQTIYAQDLLKLAESWLAGVMKSKKLKKAIGYGLIFLIISAGVGAY